jgi:O-antigen/teichoic acid export membrane protein
VRTLLGSEYLGVMPILFLVAPAALAVPMVRIALALAVVRGRARLNLQLGVAALAVFLAGSLLLVPRYTSRGVAAALTSAIIAAALVALLQMRGTGVLTEARMGRQVFAVSVPAALLLLAGGSPHVALAAGGVYLFLLLALRVVDRSELRGLRDLAPVSRRGNGRSEERWG